jgi:F1F0 ATPase subunit 2
VTGFIGLVGAFAAGSAVGAAYFTGLWATVRRLSTARNPAVLVFASFALRLGVAAVAFLAIAGAGGWAWTVAALTGFMLARAVVVRRLGPAGASCTSCTRDA